MKIDAKLRGQLPQVAAPQPFDSGDGIRQGWQLTLPGGRPLATPAVVGGRIFLGGGFGSYDFYALDAATGNLLWQYQTEDDGPTAAVVWENFVAFNTESCELEILTTEGRAVWKKWLGDPLMSMPALDGGRVYQVYPDSRGDHRHYLGAFGLFDGKELWKQPLTGEIITAPVLSEGCVYVTNLDGTMTCFRQENGEQLWQESKSATSSPVVWDGECYFSQRREVLLPKAGNPEVQQMEELAMRGKGAYGGTKAYGATSSPADHLDYGKRKARSPHYAASMCLDSSVGFGFHKGDAKMDQAQKNLGHDQVSSLWAYQGSKPFLYRGRLFSAVGDLLHCLDPVSQEVHWKKRLYDRDDAAEVLDNVLTPPALVNGKLFLGTIRGEICCLAAESGELLWRVDVKEPVIFQPAVMGGRVFAGSSQGNLYCLATGDPADDGWAMWGGNAGHNGLLA